MYQLIMITAVLSTLHNSPINRKDVNCLATAVYSEARGESLKDRYGIAHLVMNRVDSGRYPSQPCEVIYEQRRNKYTNKLTDMFTGIHSIHPDRTSKAWKDSVITASLVLLGKSKDPTNGATLVYAPLKCTPNWDFTKTTATLETKTLKFLKEN